MKTFLLTVAVSTLAFLSAFNVRADQADDIAKVEHLANRIIMGSDVRKHITVYENTDGNPCAEEGTSYIVKVQVRKSVRTGENAQVRQWQTFNTYSISKQALDNGKELTDSVCEE